MESMMAKRASAKIDHVADHPHYNANSGWANSSWDPVEGQREQSYVR